MLLRVRSFGCLWGSCAETAVRDHTRFPLRHQSATEARYLRCGRRLERTVRWPFFRARQVDLGPRLVRFVMHLAQTVQTIRFPHL